MAAVVTTRELTARYGKRVVLRGIDVDVPAGVSGLLGPNGAGKTTWLHTLCGLRPPASGSVSVLDTDPSQRVGRRELAAGVGFLPQHLGFYPRFRVAEFIAYAAWLKRVRKVDLDMRVQEALARVDLVQRSDERMGALSGGMLRRAGIAAAIVHRPRLLLLDEPSVGQDPAQRIELLKLLRELGEDTSVLLSTHLLDDVSAVCETVVVLHDGEVLFTGSTHDLAARGGSDPTIAGGYLAVMDQAQPPVAT